jgi:Zn-dependent protease with chaperone function
VDFYAYQADARRRTRRLIAGFVLALAAVVVALDLVLFALLSVREFARPAPLAYAERHPGVAMLFSLLVLGVIGLASLYKSLELRGGGAVIARSLGGVRVERTAADLRHKRLLNVVEEMAIASGVPMPEVYVLEQEPGINAFAAGHTPANAAITVTQGALDRLERDELEGVIGHEFSHILNGDMRLNLQLMGWLFGLLVVALIGRMILAFGSRGRDRRDAGGVVVVALAMVALGYVGLLAGRILQAAVSRQRERLADASSVQFTRNPLGLKGALLKIAALTEGSHLRTTDAEQVAHMLFAPGLARVFATHPPLLKRIRALDPHFDPHEELHRAVAASRPVLAPPQPEDERPEAGTPEPHSDTLALSAGESPAGAGVGLAALRTSVPAAAESIAAQVGQPETVHVEHARELRLSLPESLQSYAAVPAKARSFVLGLLLSRDPGVRSAQTQVLSSTLTPLELGAVQSAAAIAGDLAPQLRLPALLQLFPALRRGSPAERQMLARLASDLIHADANIDVFEFCLAKLLESLLEDVMQARAPHGSISLDKAVSQIQVLLATMATVGASDEAQARSAYQAGIQAVLPAPGPAFVAYSDWAQRLDAALPVLEALDARAKQALIEALVRTIGSDGVLEVAEAELLRTVCALLHCPLPPLLPSPAPM